MFRYLSIVPVMLSLTLQALAQDERWYTSAQAAAGKELFERNCALCHGKQGEATPDWKKPNDQGQFPPPPLNGTAHTWHHSLDILRRTVREGGAKVGGTMPAFGSVLSEEAIGDYVERGLRARLMTKSALTGQLFVDLEIFPDGVESYTFPGTPIEGLPQIPSTKNEIERVLESIARSVDQISKIEFGEVVANIDNLITDLNGKIDDLDLKGISDKANSTLTKAEKTIDDLDALLTAEEIKDAISNLNLAAAELKDLVAAIDEEKVNLAIENASDAMAKASETMDKAGGAIDNVGGAAGNLQSLTDQKSATMVRLNRALASFEEASRSIKDLADYLKRNPNALLSGKKRP